MPPRISSRVRVSDDLVNVVARRLTDRDRWLCEILFEHRVLTTDQVCQLAFGSLTTGRHRVTQLFELRVLDRFRPFRFGTVAPYHYVLDALGAEVVAAERGVDMSALGWRRDRALQLTRSTQLEHLVGVNGFFCALVCAARRNRGAALSEWWSARRCAREWGELVRPDGYGVWVEDSRTVAFFVEHDLGTEQLARLAEKVDRYCELGAATGSTAWVLFDLPGPRRERELRQLLGDNVGVPVATAVTTGTRPDGPIWLSSDAATRCRLSELEIARAGAGFQLDRHRR